MEKNIYGLSSLRQQAAIMILTDFIFLNTNILNMISKNRGILAHAVGR